MIEIHGRQGKSKDRRSGASTCAFTECDRSRTLAASSKAESSGGSSEHRSQGSCKYSSVFIEEETESEEGTSENLVLKMIWKM